MHHSLGSPLADAQLWSTITRLIAARCQAEEGSDGTRATESFGIVDGHDEGQRDQRPYASDLSLLDAATMPHAISWMDDSYQIASLDHAMWFHRDFRADAWLLYEQESPAAAGARGFATGRLFTRDGRLVVSVVQEGLIRPRARGDSQP